MVKIINDKKLDEVKHIATIEGQDNNEAVIEILCAMILKYEFVLEKIIDFIQEIFPIKVDSTTISGILEICRRYKKVW